MLIGIISDTHDHIDNLKKAVDIFNANNVEHIIHAGDFTSPFTWRVLKSFNGGFTGIFGNNDGEKILLNKLYSERIYAQPHKFVLKSKKIVVMHEPDVVEALADSGHFDLIVFGHTHEPVVSYHKNTLIVNPGEVCGWLHGKPTVATVDLKTMTAEIIEL